MIRIKTTGNEQGITLLEVLQRRIPQAPASYLRHLIRKGRCLHNGSPANETDPVERGDTLDLPETARLRQLIDLSENNRVDVLCETGFWLAVYKPSGLAVHRSAGHEDDNLLQRVESLMTSRHAPFSVAPVHRLDIETSGPVLFAKGKKAAGILGRAFMEGAFEKTYLALVSGILPETGYLTTPVPAKGKLKESLASYRLIGSQSGFSLAEITLHSGRTHQIRRQMADAGHPLAGDRRYGGKTPQGLDRLFLHATHLKIPPLFEEGPVSIVSPLPQELMIPLTILEIPIPKEFGGNDIFQQAPP